MGYGQTASGPVVFIWDEGHGMRSLPDVLVTDYGLDLSGWDLIAARAITPDGLTIVGTGRRGGWLEAWIAVIPEPSTGMLFAAGLLGLALRRRRAC